jgi:hypothetical protein
MEYIENYDEFYKLLKNYTNVFYKNLLVRYLNNSNFSLGNKAAIYVISICNKRPLEPKSLNLCGQVYFKVIYLT